MTKAKSERRMRDVAGVFSFGQGLRNRIRSKQDTWKATDFEFENPIVIPDITVWENGRNENIAFDIKIDGPTNRYWDRFWDSFWVNAADSKSAIQVHCFYLEKPDIELSEKALEFSEIRGSGPGHLHVTRDGLTMHNQFIPRQIKQRERSRETWQKNFVKNFTPILFVRVQDHSSKTSLIGYRYIDSKESSVLDDYERLLAEAKYGSTRKSTRSLSLMFLLLSCPLLKTLQQNIRRQIQDSISKAQTIYDQLWNRNMGLVLDHHGQLLFICDRAQVFEIFYDKYDQFSHYEIKDEFDIYDLVRMNEFLTTEEETREKIETILRDVRYKMKLLDRLPDGPAHNLWELETVLLGLHLLPGSQNSDLQEARGRYSEDTLTFRTHDSKLDPNFIAER